MVEAENTSETSARLWHEALLMEAVRIFETLVRP
jgi:hypothetical protein